MYYFPLIEKVIAWAKGRGSKVYWVWLVSVSVCIGGGLTVWADYSWETAKYPILFGLLLWLGGWLPVAWYEKNKWNKLKE